MFGFRNQPLRAVYFTYVVVTGIFLRLPYCFLRASIPSLRTRPSWTLKREIMTDVMRNLIATLLMIRIRPLRAEDPKRFVTNPPTEHIAYTRYEPIPENLILGEVKGLGDLNRVRPEPFCGYWIKLKGAAGKPDEKAGPDEKVLMHLHGGGYIATSSYPEGDGCGNFYHDLLSQCTSMRRIFSCGYRLSTSAPFPATNAFPAALFDALAGYYHLLHVAGFRAENVSISGDSAGGHLALALTRYIALYRPAGLPMPGRLVLLSPTVEWEITHDGPHASFGRNLSSDYCTPFFWGYVKRSLLGNMPDEAAATSPWISPGSLRLRETQGLFKGLPKTYVTVGDAEILLDAYRTFRDRLVADIGEENVTYVEVMDATHDFVTQDWHEPERTNSMKEIVAWAGWL
ncbi:Alpha/Beta hydrolase protein [Rhodofomes roseus]|uniref:Alpha/Beta hydrolase protein n=1 Tax=Rhodofomes roseus TaxID=34475 RepID=A0ABQ8KAK0_9APHY|nr:Alpha/Beta hydrolase protein [Rhodofomes roseus]KAH9834541.1 Alpha/Beta hydrolase protein [Rhodofomes roseus]